jgi:hypothetical protein
VKVCLRADDRISGIGKERYNNKLKLLSELLQYEAFSAVFFGWLAESSGPHVFAYIGLDINPSVGFP